MRSLVATLVFVALTVICWGNYGPLMHQGQEHMGNALRPFIGVGFAYFLIAVLAPLLMLRTGGEKGYWTTGGTVYSLIAGSVGAIGALGVILAFTFKGQPVYVMPLVFGGAPIVNTIVTMAMAKTYDRVSAPFLIAILTASLGAAGVLYFKPGRPAPAAVAAGEAIARVHSDADGAVAAAAEVSPIEAAPPTATPSTPANIPLVIASIIAAIVCWGSYGPMLHKGQMKMGGSRLRPFLCVGIAYFFIAVALPLAILPLTDGGFGDWTTEEMRIGLYWSLAGGAAGAVGALGIVLAFNFGGKPIFVMPLIFGLAPIVNTITTVTGAGSWGRIGPEFIIALLVTIVGAVCVLVFAPKSGKPQPVAGPSETTVPAAS